MAQQEMTKDQYIEELEATIFDLFDGGIRWQEIKNATGLSDRRCREMEATANKVLNTYPLKHT